MGAEVGQLAARPNATDVRTWIDIRRATARDNDDLAPAPVSTPVSYRMARAVGRYRSGRAGSDAKGENLSGEGELRGSWGKRTAKGAGLGDSRRPEPRRDTGYHREERHPTRMPVDACGWTLRILMFKDYKNAWGRGGRERGHKKYPSYSSDSWCS